MTYQKLIIVGFLGGDPVLRFTEKGIPVASFSVGTLHQWKNEQGWTNKETTWFKVTCWRRTAEIAADYLKKGQQVMIEGRLTPDKATGSPRIWTGNDGAARASYEMVADRLVLLVNKGIDGDSPRRASGGGGGGEYSEDEPDFDGYSDPEIDDIPF